MNKHKKTIFFLSVVLVLFFFPLKKTQAAIWPGIDPIIMDGLNEIRYIIHGTILGILKQQAAVSINLQIDNLIGGGSGGSARFIVDWRDYLINQPKNQADRYINAYIDQTLSGRGSSSYIPAEYDTCFGGACVSQGKPLDGKNYADYASEGFFSSKTYAAVDPNSGNGVFVGENYRQKLAEVGKKATSETPEKQFNYEGEPSRMFEQGNFQNMSLYLSGINNPWSFELDIEQKYAAKLQTEGEIARTKSLAYQGGIGTGEKNGQGLITNPGSVVLGAVINAQDIGNKIVAAATHPQEVIVAVVSQLINKAIQQGIGQVQAKVQGAVNKINQVSREATSRVQNSGPGAMYR